LHLVFRKLVNAVVELAVGFLLSDFVENERQRNRDQAATDSDYQAFKVALEPGYGQSVKTKTGDNDEQLWPEVVDCGF